MASYHFFTVSDVLPGVTAPKRRYIRGGCRPHLAWSSATAQDGVGTMNRLKGDGTGCRADTQPADDARTRALARLVTVDGESGTRLVSFTRSLGGSATATATCQTDRIPSGRCITATLLNPMAQDEAASASGQSMPSLFCSDDRGNVFELLGQQDQGPHSKRVRTEGGSAAASGGTSWRLVTPDRSAMTSDTVPQTSGGGLGLNVTRGTPGWAGLGWAAATQQLISAREGFFDVRAIDVNTGSVVRTNGTTHGPTGMATFSSTEQAPMANCVVVTEGCLATVFDLRSPSSVMSLAATVAATTGPDGAPVTGQSTPQSAPPPPLVPNRLSSTTGRISDVCHTAAPFEIAMSIDRALCVYDCRKFTRLWTSSNVLKYSIGSIAPLAGGRAIVCAGIDAEVRIVTLFPKSDDSADAIVSFAELNKQTNGKSNTSKQTGKQQPAEDGGADTRAPAADDPSKSTFRTRLNSSVSCETTWQGGWVTCANDGGSVAVSVSSNNELFLAQ